jgi:hypothetical protein
VADRIDCAASSSVHGDEDELSLTLPVRYLGHDAEALEEPGLAQTLVEADQLPAAWCVAHSEQGCRELQSVCRPQ